MSGGSVAQNNPTNNVQVKKLNFHLPHNPSQLTLHHLARDLARPLPERDFTFADFCKRITSHGLVDWYEAKSSMAKWWWASLIIGSMSILVFQICQEVSEFYLGPIQTTLSYVPALALPFPLVYVCPMSFVDSRCVDNWTMFKQKTAVFKKRSGSFLEQAQSNWRRMAPTVPSMAPPFKSRTGMYRPCGHRSDNYYIDKAMRPEDYFRECSFNSQTFTCVEAVDTIVDKEYGVCYLMNVSKAVSAQHAHSGYQNTENVGLTLLLDVHTEMYPTDEQLRPLFDGAVIRVDDRIDPADIGGTLVQAGTHSRIGLDMQEINLIDIGYSSTPQRCISESEHVMQFFNTTYSVQSCRMDCMQNVIFNVCNCVMPFDNRFVQQKFWETAKCNQTQFENCVEKTIQVTHKKYLETCTAKCFIACHRKEFRTALSHLRLPSVKIREKLLVSDPGPPSMAESSTMIANDTSSVAPLGMNSSANELQPNVTDPALLNVPASFKVEDGWHIEILTAAQKQTQYFSKQEMRRWQDNYILLDIAFEKLEYIQIQQSPPKTITTLLSNIGGQAGLWTGASIFTIVQILVFSVYLAYSKCKFGVEVQRKRSLARRASCKVAA